MGRMPWQPVFDLVLRAGEGGLIIMPLLVEAEACDGSPFNVEFEIGGLTCRNYELNTVDGPLRHVMRDKEMAYGCVD